MKGVRGVGQAGHLDVGIRGTIDDASGQIRPGPFGERRPLLGLDELGERRVVGGAGAQRPGRR